MVSRILALFAVLALLAAPLNAAAAQRACDHMEMMVAGPTVMPGMVADDGQPMPCCDPGPSHTDQACLAACVVMAGVVADLPRPPRVAYLPAVVWTRFAEPPATALRTHPPPALERPPRSNA